jgi:pilus assembly protein Flp/PilA
MSKLRTSKIAALAPLVRRFMREDGGATAIEYAMIASGVAVAISAAVMNLGSNVTSLFNSVATAMK